MGETEMAWAANVSETIAYDVNDKIQLPSFSWPADFRRPVERPSGPAEPTRGLRTATPVGYRARDVDRTVTSLAGHLYPVLATATSYHFDIVGFVFQSVRPYDGITMVDKPCCRMHEAVPESPHVPGMSG
jgi:hypothetical protein